MLDEYYSNRLDGKFFSGLSSIKNAIERYQESCTLYGFSASECHELIQCILYDCPEYYYCMLHLVSLEPSSVGTKINFFYANCNESEFEAKVDSIVHDIEQKITPYTSDWSICKLIYDYLAKTVEPNYNLENEYNSIDKSNFNSVKDFVDRNGFYFTAYGALVEKNAVCMGIAFAYKLLLKKFRIEATLVNAKDSMSDSQDFNHALNVVELDNNFAYVDVTKGRIENLNMIRYDCFMLSNKYIKRFWTLEEEFACDTMKYSYFYKNKTLFKDLNELRMYLNGCSFDKTNGEIRFLYDGKIKDNDYLEKIIEDTFRIRCGIELEVKGYIVDRLIGNCILGKR